MSTDCGIALNPPSNNSNHQCLNDIPSLLLTRSSCQTASDRVCSVSLGAENSNSKLSPPLPTRKLRHLSAPGDIPVHRQTSPTVAISHSLETSTSFPPTSSDDEGGEGDWMAPDPVFVVQRAVSVGSKQYGFTSLGRGFNWLGKEEEERNRIRRLSRSRSRSRRSIEHPLEDAVVTPPPTTACILGESLQFEPEPQRPQNGTVVPTILAPSTESSSSNPPVTPLTMSRDMGYTVLSISPSVQSPVSSRRSTTPPSPTTTRPTAAHSPTSPRPPSRRRSSHKRVSLVAGRIRVTEDMPLPGTDLPPTLGRTNSQSSFLSAAASTGPPSPLYEHEHFLGNHHINDYVIEGEAGRGAYGMVKRAREKLSNGQRGPPLIVKQVIKSRILADCWKKHPKHGTIPIEIYVMSSISNTSYVLPPRRPWDPSRPSISHPGPISPDWEEGAVVKGHPNICPLIDFFEDAHFYYLVMPSTSPPPSPHEEVLPSDLFDLVELYPQGLPAHLIRSYLGQIADALCFLHSKGIVHRDIKDENVVLGPSEGKCILIDFGSSGIVRRGGWDTFSGTLDYAGPEILRGESYNGKEQDVWAFGVVAFVLLVGECPFMTPTEAQEGLTSPFAKARMALDERCQEGHEDDGEESDGGGRLGDAHSLVMACLEVDLAQRPTFEKVLSCRFLAGHNGW